MLQFIPVFFGATFLIFALVFLMPGDPIRALSGDKPLPPDVVEAILGAVYVDGGAEKAFAVVFHLLGGEIADRLNAPQIADPRSSLQEELAKDGRKVSFEFVRTGPDHAVVYTATATVDGGVIGTGSGASKKSAAIDAARNALTAIREP